ARAGDAARLRRPLDPSPTRRRRAARPAGRRSGVRRGPALSVHPEPPRFPAIVRSGHESGESTMSGGLRLGMLISVAGVPRAGDRSSGVARTGRCTMAETASEPIAGAASPEAFTERAFGDLVGALTVSLAVLGDRLGLFKNLAAGGPATS